ncbi:MAG: HAD-IA family hydrolase [Candidatus Hodarchaeales archaeon]|jgi:putative hydrolase of the HAD superfamily
MVRIQVIFLNAGGTLLQLKGTTLPILYSQLISQLIGKHISSDIVYQGFRKAEEWTLSRKSPGTLFSDLDKRKYQNAFYNQIGVTSRKQINLIEREIADQLELEFVLEKGAKLVLNKLKSKYKIGLISNWDESLIDHLEDLGILDYFESITLSGEIEISKPDLGIFKSALNDFPKVKPKETVYIGDDYQQDILPALIMKMKPILFDKGPSGMHGRPFQPEVKCIKIRELIESLDVIKKLNDG